MKKAKLLIIPLLSTFLAGCASSSIAGQYVFQMGKTKGSHFGIYLTLTDEVVKDESQATIGKKLSFQFALMSGTDTPQVEANAETAAQVEATKALGQSLIRAANKDPEIPSDIGDFSLVGYYVHNPELVQKDDEGNDIIPVGVSSIKYTTTDGKEESIDVPIPPSSVEKIVYNTYSGNTFTLVTPVSITDALLQIYWYGYDFENFEEVTPHAVGTSPTDEEVNEINKTYPDKHSGKKFRKFHKLHMGLTKY